MLYQLAIEIEPDDHGVIAVVIDASDDSVLHVSNSYSAPEDAD